MVEVGTVDTALTHSQRQIWLGQQLHPDCPLYNMAFAFVFPVALEVDTFCQAWNRIVDGSDALRTRLISEEGGRIRRIIASGSCRTKVLDFSQRPDPVGEFAVMCRQRAAHALPLDGDLVDSVLVLLEDGRTGWYLNQHHLVTDAWSTQLLFNQVGIEYAALLAGSTEGPWRGPSYYSTARDLASRAAGDESVSDHWQASRERPGRLVHLYGRPPLSAQTASTRLTLELDRERSQALEALGREDGFHSPSDQLSRLALFATLLSSWLYRISGSGKVGFDAPVAGRPTPPSKETLGVLIEMFPFAARVSPEDSFRTLGSSCLGETMQFLGHALPGTSSPTGSAASNVVLNYFPAAFEKFAGLPVEVEWIHPGHTDSVHTLRLQVHDFSGSGQYRLHFDYHEEALPEALRVRSLRHFETLLAAMLKDPDRPISDIELLAEDERHRLQVLNTTDGQPLPDQTVVEMFEARAEVEAERTALRQGSQQLCFGSLRDKAHALAETLVRKGVKPGDRVAILSRRSISAVVATLAVLRARAAYVPVDANVPQRRLDHVLKDSGARLLLIGDLPRAGARPSGVEVLVVEEGVRAGRPEMLERTLPGLEDLAYLIYTSGSTGQPKGVLVEHGGLSDYLGSASRQYVRGDRLTFPLFTSLAFDLTVTSLFLPLITGGLLDIYPEPEGPADSALMDVVRADRVEFIKLTPSHLSLLRRIGLEGSRLRRMVVGGENLRADLAAAVSAQLHDQIEIYNEYGPTEAVVGCIVHRFEPGLDTEISVPIGKPMDHVTVEILNESRSPVPEGVPGELWVSRFGLARGYHGLGPMTADRFVSRGEGSEARRYRTGDLVRIVDGRGLEYLGRRDRQLKISGFRVEPGEVEAAMLSFPSVEQCAVMARRRESRVVPASFDLRHCLRCGLPSNYPRAVFDEDGVCSLCYSYEAIKPYAEDYFKTQADLRRIFEDSSPENESEYDCMLLLSGGKDSTYALCRLVDLGLSVYAFSLDNGYISEEAKANIRKVTSQLGVPVEFATTPAMKDIFRDSLERFSNVCNGCFKTIYTLSLQRARELGIPRIVTGLSRGQMFETRLTAAMFRDGRCSPEEVDDAVLAARRVYHRVPDEVTRSLGTALFRDDRIFEEIQFVDFYRYVDVGMDEVYSYLRQKVSWSRPSDTGRSTNCLINDVGILIHQRERGFHNYALPYSWDVRMGHKTREAAIRELDDQIDEENVRTMLQEIGYSEGRSEVSDDQTVLEAFFVATREVSEDELRHHLEERLPLQLVPVHLQPIDSIPLTASGKLDEVTLRSLSGTQLNARPYREPQGPVEEYLAQIWEEELGTPRVGADDDFFALGGTSLIAMEVMLEVCREFSIDLPLDTMFSHTTLASFARIAENRILADAAEINEGRG